MSANTQSATARAANRRWLFAGTFLVSLALLAFEVMTVRTINFTVGPSYIYIAIALAMLGLSGAGSILSLVNLRALRFPRDQLLFWICVAIALLLLFSHFLAADLKAELNPGVRAAGISEGLPGVVTAGAVGGFVSALKVGLSLSLPYFLFGALLTLLFTSTDDCIYGRLYASDLIGAALGCVCAIVVMELTGYAVSVTAPAIAVLLGGACYVWPSSRRLGMLGVVAAALVSVLPVFGALPIGSSRRPTQTIWPGITSSTKRSARCGAAGTALPASVWWNGSARTRSHTEWLRNVAGPPTHSRFCRWPMAMA